MNLPVPKAAVAATDFSQFAGLRAAAQRNDPKALRQAAQQFEALLTETLLKTSRQTQFGDDLTGEQGDFYKDMYDQQMALHLSSGRGLGLADMLVRQLSGLPAGIDTGGASGKAGAASTGDTPPPLSLSSIAPVVDAAISPFVRTSQPHGPKPGDTPPTHMPAPVSARSGTSGGDAAAASAPASHPAGWQPKNAQEFIDAVRPHAEKAAAALGVPARALIAQAALETGWGQHLAKQANGSSGLNLFGVKAQAGWSGARQNQATTEFENGKLTSTRADFRAYGSIGAAFDDYVQFLKTNPRYTAALRTGDVHGFAHALQKAGYATDPQYAQKLVKVAYGAQMTGGYRAPATVTV